MEAETLLSPTLKRRVEALAARSDRTSADVVADALENGHSIAWQERFLDYVAKEIASADKGDFASGAEIEQVLNKYRSA